MKQHPLWRAAPMVLAALFVLSYAGAVFGLPAILTLFRNFQIELPSFTVTAIGLSAWLVKPLSGAIFGVVMLSLAFAIALGERWAWWLGLALTIFFGLCLLSTVPPLIALMNSVSGANAGAPFPGVLWPQIALVLLPACLPTLAFLALRRPFWRACAPQTST